MCAVAKSYQRCDIMGEPFTQNGRQYVTIETPFGELKNVRWYTDAEYARMYKETEPKRFRSLKSVLGFGDAGYIYVYLGNTYEHLAWFKAEPECRYHKIWGWFTPSNEEVSNDLPEGIRVEKLCWEDVSYGTDVSESLAEKAVNNLKYKDLNSLSEYIGEIGDRDTFELTVKKAISLESFYGSSTMHIMEDKNGNTFVWNTASKTLEVNKTYRMKGTIKDHKEYRGVKQTILTRCTLLKDKE